MNEDAANEQRDSIKLSQFCSSIYFRAPEIETEINLSDGTTGDIANSPTCHSLLDFFA